MEFAVLAFVVVLTMCVYGSTTEFENHQNDCSSFVNVTKYSPSGAELSIPMNETSVQKAYLRHCFYTFTFFSNTSAIKISMSKYYYPFWCSTNVMKIRFFLEMMKDGYKLNPVKEIYCGETGEWVILWPWREVVMEIVIRTPASIDYVLKINPTLQSSDHLQYYKPNRKKVKLPYDPSRIYHTVPEFCLGSYRYEVIYRSETYYSLNAPMHKVRFRLDEKSVCIRTGVLSLSDVKTYSSCPWKVYLKVNGKVIMILRCENIEKYWCLPESWFEEINEHFEIQFSGVNVYGLYRIFVTTNASAYGVCPLKSTLSYEVHTTKGSGTNIYKGEDSSLADVGIIVPVVGLVVFMCVFFLASYIKSKRRNAQNSGLNSSHLPRIQTNSYTDVRNPAYRSHDAVTYRATTAAASTNYSAPPPNYSGVIANSPPPELPDGDTALLPSYGEVTNQTDSVPAAPPPSYEDALDMIQNSDAIDTNLTNTDENISINDGNRVTYSPDNSLL